MGVTAWQAGTCDPGALQVFLVKAPPRQGFSGHLWGMVDAITPGGGLSWGRWHSGLGTPALVTSCFAGGGQPLCCDTPTPTPPQLLEPRTWGRGVQGGRLRSPPVRERKSLRSAIPGSYIICSVRFKCHCRGRLTWVPTQWAPRGALAVSSSSWQ